MPPLVVLIGAPGAGKTTVGRLAAERLAAPFRDTDDQVAHEAGQSVGEIFVTEGEAGFRRREAAAARDALWCDGAVVALGSGAIEQADIVALLTTLPLVVHLSVGAPTAAQRTGLDVPRPVSLGAVRGEWTRLLTQRRATYERLATVTIDTDGLSPNAVTRQVLATVAPSS